MTPGPADLAEFRLVQALRAGRPGAFPTLWNAQAGAIWSVVRALCETDAEAVGWATTFRVELGERAGEFGAGEPVAAQVGVALYQHLKEGFARTAPLPEAPVPATEEGVRRVPEAARLLYLVDLFFDVPVEALERHAGKGARRTLEAVHALIDPSAPVAEPNATWGPDQEEDARLYVHAALMKSAPVDVLLLPPGAAPEPPRPKWWLLVVALALVVGLASLPSVLAWFDRPDLAELGTRHAVALEDAPLRGSDPVAMGIELARRGLPALLTEVPDLSAADLTLLGARVLDGPEPSIVLTYHGDTSLWTLQHLKVAPELDGVPAASRDTPQGRLDAYPAWPGTTGVATMLVPWKEGGTTWVLSADAPPDTVLERAARIRDVRATPDVPFLGSEPAVPRGGGSE